MILREITSAFNTIQDLPADCENLDNPVLAAQAERVRQKWHLAVHLIVRELYNPQHQVPIIDAKGQMRFATKRELKKYAPWALLLAKEWELCEKCHSGMLLNGFSIPYKNGPDWFAATSYESKRNDILSIPCNVPRGNKREIIEDLRIVAQAFQKQRNPYQELENQIHNYHLIKAALFLSKGWPLFKEKYFVPYVKAYRAFTNAIHENKNIGAVFGQKGKLYVQAGKGETKRLLAG